MQGIVSESRHRSKYTSNRKRISSLCSLGVNWLHVIWQDNDGNVYRDPPDDRDGGRSDMFVLQLEQGEYIKSISGRYGDAEDLKVLTTTLGRQSNVLGWWSMENEDFKFSPRPTGGISWVSQAGPEIGSTRSVFACRAVLQ